MALASRPLRRNAFFTSGDGVQTIMVRRREVFPLELDWSDDLDDGETITASEWRGDFGLVVSTPSFDAGTNITRCVVNDGFGEAVNQVTTSSGRVMVEVLRVRNMDGHRVLDYGR
jgi:hypothetical protein